MAGVGHITVDFSKTSANFIEWVSLLRDKIEKQDREIERLWQRIHALSETLEDRSVH